MEDREEAHTDFDNVDAQHICTESTTDTTDHNDIDELIQSGEATNHAIDEFLNNIDLLDETNDETEHPDDSSTPNDNPWTDRLRTRQPVNYNAMNRGKATQLL